MECGICDKQIRRRKNIIGRYYHHYYLFREDSYMHECGDYNTLYPNRVNVEPDVMVCSKHFIQNRSKIKIHRHLHKTQSKRYLIGHLRKHFKIYT
jgi:hypothetical protein